MLNKSIGLLENASAHGFEIDRMLEFVHWIMAILFVGWSIFFIITLVKFHRSRNPKADYHGVKSKASTHIELMVVLVELVFLLGFGIPIWASRVQGAPPNTDVFRIRVIAQQFLWNFHYPGPDGVFGPQKLSLVSESNPLGLDMSDPTAHDDLVVLNEAHVPLNKNVIMDISSKDVIHNVALKHMRAAQDAIPGMVVPIWFKPIKTGSFEMVCGQLCGTSHYAMRGFLVVDSDEDFATWEKEMQALKAPLPTAQAPAAADEASDVAGL